MEELNGVLQQVVIEVFVKVEKEVQTYLLWIHDLLDSHFHIINITVGMVSLNYGRTVPARYEEVDITSSFPFILSHNLLSFVVHIVDGSGEGFTLSVPEGVEH